MDHAQVEERDLVQSYLAGRLSESERDDFEAHYFSCEACLERLESEVGFREGMRQVAAEDIVQVTAARVRLGLFAALAALSLRHRLALAGALLLLAALPGLWLAAGNRALRRELAVSAAGAAGAERERATLEARLHGLEQARAGDRNRHAAELARERERQVRAALPQTPQPQANVPLFLLAAVRSGEPAGREPVNQLPLSPTAGSVILAAELATVDHPSYRATLHAADGRELWQAEGLHPDSRDTLVLLLPASMLPPGVYRLTIEGKSGGGWLAVAAYPFRVVRRP